VLFNDALASGVTLQGSTDRASCQIVSDSSAPQGSNVLLFSTDSWLANGDNCALVFPREYDLSAYTEIDFWLRSNRDGQYITQSMKSTNSSIEGFGMPIVGTEWKHYRFPLPQTFNQIDLHHVISAFLIQLQLNSGDEIRVDYIRLLCRDYYPIFSDVTEPGRAEVQPGDGQCTIQTDSDQHVSFNVDPNAWSCYLTFHDPSLRLNGFDALQVTLKSYQDVLIFVQDRSVRVPSTNGASKIVKILLSEFGSLDLSNVNTPFAIQRTPLNSGVAAKQILVTDVRYLKQCNSNPELYCNNFEQQAGSEWSSPLISTSPVGNRRYLGGFDNQNVSLTLKNISEHSYLKVEFDLFIMFSWDGAHVSYGPDVWKLVVGNGPVLLRTTFSNVYGNPPDYRQHYPGTYPGSTSPATTGAIERGTLGYNVPGYYGYGDTVYHLSFVFSHKTPKLTLYFGNEHHPDGEEDWGIDNLCVSIVDGPKQ